jgi:hypothetical protein
MSLYREDLDHQGCATPNCTHDHSVIFLHGRCHPQAATETKYVKATGTIEVSCVRCKRHIASIHVASIRVASNEAPF